MHCPAKTDSEMPSAGEVELQLAGLGTSARTQKIDLHPHNQIKNLLKQARDSLPLTGELYPVVPVERQED